MADQEEQDRRRQTAQQFRAGLVKLAEGDLVPGVLHEPRGYYDLIALDTEGQITAGNPEVFKNGEQFPVRITHMVASLGLVGQDGGFVDPRFIQRIGIRWIFHNQFYMNPTFNALPAFINKVTAPPQLIDFSNCSWKFDVPFVLSTRDTLDVELVNTNAAENEPIRMDVTVHGIGLLSGRPYMLSGSVVVEGQQRTRLDPTFFRNDGSEPIACSQLAISASMPEDDASAGQFIETVLVQIRQAGNGTNAEWFRGPDGAIQLIPASLIAQTTGRSIVHRFPGDGLIWEPGEGVQVQARALGEVDDFQGILGISLLGYITVA